MPMLSLLRCQTLLAALMLATLLCLGTVQAALPDSWNDLPAGEMTVKDPSIHVVIVSTNAQQHKTRELLDPPGENEGVLHILNYSNKCHLMSGVDPALSLAYLDEDGHHQHYRYWHLAPEENARCAPPAGY